MTPRHATEKAGERRPSIPRDRGTEFHINDINGPNECMGSGCFRMLQGKSEMRDDARVIPWSSFCPQLYNPAVPPNSQW